MSSPPWNVKEEASWLFLRRDMRELVRVYWEMSSTKYRVIPWELGGHRKYIWVCGCSMKKHGSSGVNIFVRSLEPELLLFNILNKQYLNCRLIGYNLFFMISGYNPYAITRGATIAVFWLTADYRSIKSLTFQFQFWAIPFFFCLFEMLLTIARMSQRWQQWGDYC